MSSAPPYALLALVAVIISPMSSLQAAEPSIEVVRDGKLETLSDQARSYIRDHLPKLFSNCSFNSRDDPPIFASWGLTTIWEETVAKDHLIVKLPTPIELRGVDSRAIPVEQLLLGLQDPEFPGPELSRSGEQVIAYVKCSGLDVIKFVWRLM
jgi:hypothetical protein